MQPAQVGHALHFPYRVVEEERKISRGRIKLRTRGARKLHHK
jgi:hypothetical protein